MGKYTEKQKHNVKYKQVNLIRNNNNITQCNSSSSNNVVTVSLHKEWRNLLGNSIFLPSLQRLYKLLLTF